MAADTGARPGRPSTIRDGVLEASASARGGLEAVFFSWLGLTRSCLGLGSVWKVAPCLGSVVISQLTRASAYGAQVQV